MSGSRTTASNNRVISFGGDFPRTSVIGCTFKNIGASTVGTDNPACVFNAGLASTRRQYSVCVDNIAESTAGVQLYCSFNTEYILVENNVGDNIIDPSNSNSEYIINIKDDSSYVTVRANTVAGDAAVAGIRMHNQNGLTDNTDQEVCYNIVTTITAAVDGGIEWHTHTGSTPVANTYDYRNSIRKTAGRAYRILVKTPNLPVEMSASVYYGDNGTGLPSTGATEVAPAGAALALSDFTSTGLLTGTARTSYLGTKSAEVAG